MKSRLNWWYILYELILVCCMIAYWRLADKPVSECTSVLTLWDAVIGLIPLVIILLMVAPGFMVLHDP